MTAASTQPATPVDDYRALREGEFSAPGDLVLEDGRRGLNRCERVSQMEPTDAGSYFRMERIPDHCSIHTHYVLDDGSGCLCGYFTKRAPATQPASTGVASLHVIIRRDPDGQYSYLPGYAGTATLDQISAMNEAARDLGAGYCSLDSLLASYAYLADALRKHGSHAHSEGPMCERAKHSEYPCTCGLEAALKAATGGENGT